MTRRRSIEANAVPRRASFMLGFDDPREIDRNWDEDAGTYVDDADGKPCAFHGNARMLVTLNSYEAIRMARDLLVLADDPDEGDGSVQFYLDGLLIVRDEPNEEPEPAPDDMLQAGLHRVCPPLEPEDENAATPAVEAELVRQEEASPPTPEQWQALSEAIDAHDEVFKEGSGFAHALPGRSRQLRDAAKAVLDAHDADQLDQHIEAEDASRSFGPR